MTADERALLLELYGEAAVKRHGTFLANYHRVHALFPEQPPEPAHVRIGVDVETYLNRLYDTEFIKEVKHDK